MKRTGSEESNASPPSKCQTPERNTRRELRLAVDAREYLGSGGNAEVWRAIAGKTGEAVTLKVLRRRAGAEELEREARIQMYLANVRYPKGKT